ncbi:MAG: DUF4266 domain-containing protein [Sandaracinaceae bacterium]|nr:DUF4266 domain-containing protein [Sandaracinaceae bacterium]
MRTSAAILLASVLLSVGVSGCAIVPRYQRESLADPAMTGGSTALEDRSLGKLHGSREVAAGGDGRPAGGGCACSN